MPEHAFATTAYPLAVATRPVIPPSSLSTVHIGWQGTAEGTGAGDGGAEAGDAAVTGRKTVPNAAVTGHAIRRIRPVSQGVGALWRPAGYELRSLPGVPGGYGVGIQLGGERFVDPYPQKRAVLAMRGFEDFTRPVYPGDEVAPVVRHQRGDLNRRPGQPCLDGLDDRGGAGAGTGRAQDGVRPQPLEPQQRLLVGRVDLVDHQQLGQPVGAHLGQYLADRADLLLRVGVRPVDDVYDQVSLADLLQRGAERLDELVRKVPDEPDGVGERVDPPVAGTGPAGGRVEGGEQRVLHQDTGPGQPVEQAGLAGVGVPGDRHARHRVAYPPGPFGLPDHAHRLDLALELGDAGTDPAPVGLQLGLTGTAQAYAAPGAAAPAAAAALPGQRLPPAAQAGPGGLELGPLDPGPALPSLGVLG